MLCALCFNSPPPESRRGCRCKLQKMPRRLAHIWLALIVVLGQFMPLHAAVIRAHPSTGTTVAAADCCATECCCGDRDSCPCEIAPDPEPASDLPPQAPAPSRDADHFRAMLDAQWLTVAHPAIERLTAYPVTRAQAPRRDPSIRTQTLLSVWRN